MCKVPVSAVASDTVPSANPCVWEISKANYVSLKAAVAMPDGKIAALLHGETAPHGTALAMFAADGASTQTLRVRLPPTRAGLRLGINS